MKILCVHGVGHHPAADLSWQTTWTDAVHAALGNEATPTFCLTDDLFVQSGLTWADTWAAFQHLGGSGWNNLWGKTQRGMFDGDNLVGWTAGMVTQWAGTPELREKTRDLLKSMIVQEEPDVILAHSLGSLISYDLFSQDPSQISGRAFVSFGSQINNGFVRGIFKGGVVPLPADSLWIHLYNKNDLMFTEPFGQDMLSVTNFRQYPVTFFDGLFGSHTDINRYLTQTNAPEGWDTLKLWLNPHDSSASRSIKAISGVSSVILRKTQPARNDRRALLIGVNKYAGKDIPTLGGCVNDVFLVSSTLQENGFAPEDVRVVLDERATADGIRERLNWLFDDVRKGDVRLLYFSGHGVNLPIYNAGGDPDRFLDALVPHDFDGSQHNSITDRDLAPFYEKIPFDAQLIMAFDCCRSRIPGKGTSGTSGKGIDLPDDIRHRMLKWNPEEEMWVLRDFPKLIPEKETDSGPNWRIPFSGKNNCTEKLGRSTSRRRIANKEFDKLCNSTGWQGPYLPVIIEACKEDESAEEYLDGQVSFGAFTYAFCHTLCKARKDKKKPSFTELVKMTLTKIHRLGYPQSPELLGPEDVIKMPIPLVSKQVSLPVKKQKSKE